MQLLENINTFTGYLDFKEENISQKPFQGNSNRNKRNKAQASQTVGSTHFVLRTWNEEQQFLIGLLSLYPLHKNEIYTQTSLHLRFVSEQFKHSSVLNRLKFEKYVALYDASKVRNTLHCNDFAKKVYISVFDKVITYHFSVEVPLFTAHVTYTQNEPSCVIK